MNKINKSEFFKKIIPKPFSTWCHSVTKKMVYDIIL